METDRFYHNSRRLYYRSPFGAAPTDSQVVLRLDAAPEAAAAEVTVRLWLNGLGERLYPMTWDGASFVAAVPLPYIGCLAWYYFIIRQDQETWYYGNNTAQRGGRGQLYRDAPPAYQITVYDKETKTPDWFKHAIVYQIFPDRFAKGDQTTAVLTGKRGAVIHSAWDDAPAYWKDDVTRDILYYDFYGGNLAGIQEKFPYLQSLGVTVIYLNPIFESVTNHRYSTADYHRVDSFLGTNDEFAAFCKKAAAAGIRIILDGVFSHTGADSMYFNKFGHYDSVGAYQSKESPYYEWYRFTDYPTQYESWWGVMDLPNVEETTPSYMDFIIYQHDSVLKYWLAQGCSGWRLDVVDELPTPFLQAFYKTLKETNPDALLIGEVWEDASNKSSYGEQRQYLCGRDLDSAMNYALRKILVDFMVLHSDGAEMQDQLYQLLEHYPREHAYAMLNLIGSHDIARILTVLQEGGTTETALRRLQVLTAWQFTLPGAPAIYYGDEAGLTGGKDPDNRRTYPWGRENQNVLAWYRKIASLRRRRAALRTGRFIPLLAQGTVTAYVRSIEGGSDVFGQPADDGFFVIVLNVDPKQAQDVTLDSRHLIQGTLRNCLDETAADVTAINGKLTVQVPPLGVAIYERISQAAPRRAGVLLHPTSLPSPLGNGEFGQEAFRFIDFLSVAGQSVWQVLPLTPPLLGDSPYLASSAFAMNERFISLAVLVEWGWLAPEDYQTYAAQAQGAATWDEKWQVKKAALWNISHDPKLTIDWTPYTAFCRENQVWLDDYALFRAVSDFYDGLSWTQWPADIRRHTPAGIARYKRELAGTISHYQFLQYIVYRQWQAVHAYARRQGISILGDMPMFVAHHSADCWAHQELFQLDEGGQPTAVAGVPPDYFSKDGQLWGNPLYDYDAMAADGYQWWIQRFRQTAQTVDEIRIDHFRGFEAYWSVPITAQTAKEGQWLKGPGAALLRAVRQALGDVPLVAEDLGVITDAVCQLKEELQLPGMKVLQFHWAERTDGQYSLDTEPHCLVYTGTHDNNTLRGWYEEELDEFRRRQLRQTLGLADTATSRDVVRRCLAYVYSRQAETAIVPLQDILGLPAAARMNVPGVADGNWQWQVDAGVVDATLAQQLASLCQTYGRGGARKGW